MSSRPAEPTLVVTKRSPTPSVGAIDAVGDLKALGFRKPTTYTSATSGTATATQTIQRRPLPPRTTGVSAAVRAAEAARARHPPPARAAPWPG